jgi:hypothetical protein
MAYLAGLTGRREICPQSLLRRQQKCPRGDLFCD